MAWNRERPHNFQEAMRAAREMLSASPELVAKGTIETEAEQLVQAAYRAASGKPITRMGLFARMQDRFPEAAGDRLLTMAGARAEGKPLQHLTGVQAFLDHEYEVGPDVLVPRPETELLVSLAIQQLESRPPALGLEIGLGSGAISVELISRFGALSMLATELTAEAGRRARANADRILGASGGRLEILMAANALEACSPFERKLAGRKADFIISNPPYLAASDPIEAEVRNHEPATALFAPPSDPLHFYREIACNSRPLLADGGKAFVELAPERATETLALFRNAGWEANLVKDLTRRNRFLFASWSGKR